MHKYFKLACVMQVGIWTTSVM